MNNPKILTARSIWLFNTTELNPQGVAAAPLYEAFRERYKFLQYPNRSEDFTKAGLSFLEGSFKGLAVGLEIYSDGLIASARTSTRISDAFLDDVLTWARDNFRYRYDALLVKTKLHESQIEFTSDLNLKKEFSRFGKFINILDDLNSTSDPLPKDVGAITFREEKGGRPLFTFERRENTPFSENRFFSGAACETDRHLQLIEEFERLMQD
jgi:hypothetical protein